MFFLFKGIFMRFFFMKSHFPLFVIMHSRGNVELMGDPLGGLNHIIDGLDLRSLGDILDGIHDVSKLVMHKLILNYVGLSNNSVHGNHVIGRFQTRVNDLALHRQWRDLLDYRVYRLGRSRARKGWDDAVTLG